MGVLLFDSPGIATAVKKMKLNCYIYVLWCLALQEGHAASYWNKTA
jgi:hypothetical protein